MSAIGLSIAARGDLDRAFALLGSGRLARDMRRASDVESLLTLADTARLSGHASAAVEPPQEIVDQHRADTRANMA